MLKVSQDQAHPKLPYPFLFRDLCSKVPSQGSQERGAGHACELVWTLPSPHSRTMAHLTGILSLRLGEQGPPDLLSELK